MAYAQEMRNLVEVIKIGHRDRTQQVKDAKEETARLMERHGAWIKDNKKNVADLLGQYAKEMRKVARDLKDFLAESEKTRKEDFVVFYEAIRNRVRVIKKDTAELMKDIRAQIKDVKGDTAGLLVQYDNEMKELAVNLKEFLKKSEADRRAGFQTMMKDIALDIESTRKSVKDLLVDYKAERKEAAGYWAPLAKKAARLGRVEEEKEEKGFKCETCGKEFSFRIALLGHMRRHPKPEVAQPEVTQADGNSAFGQRE